ncbi:MAG TPA: hypothetical protein VKA12_10665 [Roseiarcus sp.]|nr:hypothetical protein [Roseiarcus sp.]
MLRIAVAEPEDELPQVVRGSPCRSVVKTMGPSMPQSTTPSNYEDLIRTIHERYDDMSKSYQRIAVYLTQNPNDVAVLSVGAIAERCGVHASNVVRFAQALGYDGFKTLQSLFQRRLSTAAPGFEARSGRSNANSAPGRTAPNVVSFMTSATSPRCKICSLRSPTRISRKQ